MKPHEKAKATIIEKVRLEQNNPNLTDEEAYKIFSDKRYRSPEKAEKRKQIASTAGKATKKRTFNDPKKASEAANKMWEKKRGQDT